MNKKQPSIKTAQEHYARGRKHFCAGKLDDAEKHLTNAILQDPKFTEAWVVRGDVYAKTEKHDTAIENFMQALRLVSANKQLPPGKGSHDKAIILSRIAEVKLAQGKHDDAIRFSIQSMKLMEGCTMRKDFAEPWYIQGMAWLKQGRDDRALYCFTSAAAKYTRDSHYENSLLERARLLQKSWRFKEAFDACNSILQQNPDHVEALVERACSRSGEAFRWSNEDLEDLRKAVRILPEHPQAQAMLADCLFGTGRLEEAGEAAAKALELDPENQKRARRLGVILEKAQGTKEAREKALADYHAFVRSYPRAKIFSHKKDALIKEEEFDKAIAETGRVLLANPNDAGARSKRAAAWIGRGNLPNAREDLDWLVESHPDNSDFLDMRELVEFF